MGWSDPRWSRGGRARRAGGGPCPPPPPRIRRDGEPSPGSGSRRSVRRRGRGLRHRGGACGRGSARAIGPDPGAASRRCRRRRRDGSNRARRRLGTLERRLWTRSRGRREAGPRDCRSEPPQGRATPSPPGVSAGGGLATPRDAARIRAALIAGACCAVGGLAVALAGGRLVGASLDVVAAGFDGSQVGLGPIARWLGEQEFRPVTRAAVSAFEGLMFGAGLVAGLTHRPRNQP